MAVKFVKVFSLKCFPLYGICICMCIAIGSTVECSITALALCFNLLAHPCGIRVELNQIKASLCVERYFISETSTMKFVCVGILLVVLLGSALAKPNYFSGLRSYDDAIISDIRCYQCFLAPNCAGYIGDVTSLNECCYRLGGSGCWNFATCYRW